MRFCARGSAAIALRRCSHVLVEPSLPVNNIVAVSLGIAGSRDYYVSMRPRCRPKRSLRPRCATQKWLTIEGSDGCAGGRVRTRAGLAVACVRPDSLVAAKKAERLAARHPPG
jgi:hypothetical protein